MKTPSILSLAPLQVVQAVVGFGALAAFTRLMSAEAFGLYALVLSVSLAAHTLLFTWAEAAAFRHFSLSQAGRRLADHFATLLGAVVVLGALVAAATWIGLRNFAPSADVVAVTAFAAGAMVLRFVIRISRETDRAELAFGRYAAFEAIYFGLGFAAGLALLFAFDLGAAAPFAGLMIAAGVVALFDAPRLYQRARGGYATFTRARTYASYGGPLALALGIDLAVQATARLLLMLQADAAALGGYAAAFGLSRPIDLVFLGLNAAFAPLLLQAYERHSVEDARDMARRAFALMAALALPACVGLALVAQPLAALMLGESVRTQAGQALPWMALATLMSGFALYYWSEAFQLARRTGLRALLMLAPGAVQLAATFALAPMLGATGAAIASVAAAATSFCLLAAVGRGLVALPLPLGALVRILTATVAMALCVAALPQDALAARVMVGAAIYAAAALVLNIADARTNVARVLRARFAAPSLAQDTK